MSAIKIFARTLTSVEEIARTNRENQLGLTIEVPEHLPININIYGVCSHAVSLWRTRSEGPLRTKLGSDRGQVHIRIPLAGSFFYEEGHVSHITPEKATLVVARDTNPVRTSPGVDMICLELSRAKTEAYLKRLTGRDYQFDPDCTEIQLPIDAIVELRTFITRTHEAVVKIEDDVEVVYPLFEEMLMSKFALTVSDIVNNPALLLQMDPVTKLALSYIKRNLRTKITVSEIAKFVGVSVRTLEKKFRQDLGTTPIPYVIDQRLEMVHQEILESPRFAYVSQIAIRWGFSHMADFSRRYKLKFGCSPSKSRKPKT